MIPDGTPVHKEIRIPKSKMPTLSKLSDHVQVLLAEGVDLSEEHGRRINQTRWYILRTSCHYYNIRIIWDFGQRKSSKSSKLSKRSLIELGQRGLLTLLVILFVFFFCFCTRIAIAL